MKTVSIIIPVYNAEAYIKHCFANICNQTYTHSAIECVFIDDGSKDHSVELIKKQISENESNISLRLISHKKNEGVSIARNTGINEAKNEYIFFLDADDTITPDCIQILMEATDIYPDANVISGNIITKKSGLYHHDATHAFTTEGRSQNLHDTLLFIYASYSCNKLIARDFILKHRLYFPVGIPYFEDLHWNIDLARHSHIMVYLPQITYIYEDVSTSAMNMSSKRTNIIARCYMSLIEKGYSLNEPDNWTETHLFIFFYIMKLLTMSHFGNINRHDIIKARRQLVGQSIKMRQPLLFLYDLQLYQPLRWLSAHKFFRNRSAKLRIWMCSKCK